MSWTSPLVPCPLRLVGDPASVEQTSAYTGTACLALMDTGCAGEVWEDLLFDGHGHDHGAGGLMLNEASLGTHFEHDGDFPIRIFRDSEGKVLGLEVNLDPYGEDVDSLRRPEHWTDADEHRYQHMAGIAHHHERRPTEEYANPGAPDGTQMLSGLPHELRRDALHVAEDDLGGRHEHWLDEPTEHGHGDDHGHEAGHAPLAEGWSEPVTVHLENGTAVLGDPAGLPEADDTGGLLEIDWPAVGGRLTAAVFVAGGVRRVLAVVWSA